MDWDEEEFGRWRAPLQAARQRRLVWWRGSRAEGLQLARDLAACLPRYRLLTDQSLPDAVPVHSGKRWLGQEFDLLVFDAWAGFDPESFGALSGTLVAGGLLLLITPEQWSTYADPDYRRITPWPHAPESLAGHFLQRLERLLEADPTVVYWHRRAVLPPLPGVLAPEAVPRPDDNGCLGADQQRALQALATGCAPQVLVADRGRGKSATLGLYIAALLQGQPLASVADRGALAPLRLCLTAPRKDAVASALALARRRLGLAPEAPLQTAAGCCCFVAPDALLAEEAAADLILVDEAAALPVPMLTALLERQQGRRILFATTVHGYEGTGRGFAVRFRRVLDARTPGWQTLPLQQPIRWSRHDPLEALSFRALLLDAEPRAPAYAAATALQLRCVSAAELGENEALLAELFGLLVQAHYQTSPNDLRQLLDNPDQSIWLLCAGDRVVATALVTQEGGFTPDLARAIWAGRRRPRGHLLAQSLAAHGGWLLAPRQRGRRIMRIAVAEAWQRHGIGQQLVRAIVAAARTDGADWVGTSFAASADLVSFWQRLGFAPVRLGVARDACSGTYTLQVLQGLSARGQSLARAAAARFAGHWPPRVQVLEPALHAALHQGLCAAPRPLFAARQRWLDLIGFAMGQRAFETLAAEFEALQQTLRAGYPQSQALLELLELKLDAGLSWPEVARRLGLPGQKAAQQALRTLLAEYLRAELPGRWWPLRQAVEQM